MENILSRKVLLLNNSYEALGIISSKKAIIMLLSKKDIAYPTLKKMHPKILSLLLLVFFPNRLNHEKFWSGTRANCFAIECQHNQWHPQDHCVEGSVHSPTLLHNL